MSAPRAAVVAIGINDARNVQRPMRAARNIPRVIQATTSPIHIEQRNEHIITQTTNATRNANRTPDPSERDALPAAVATVSYHGSRGMSCNNRGSAIDGLRLSRGQEGGRERGEGNLSDWHG